MGPLIERRNHLSHGIWGWLVPGSDTTKAKPARLYLKNQKKEVYPDKITDTAARAATLTHKIYRVVCHLYNYPYPWPKNPHPRYFFTKTFDLDLPEGRYSAIEQFLRVLLAHFRFQVQQNQVNDTFARRACGRGLRPLKGYRSQNQCRQCAGHETEQQFVSHGMKSPPIFRVATKD